MIVSLVPPPSAPTAPVDAPEAQAEFAATLAETSTPAATAAATESSDTVTMPPSLTDTSAPSLIAWLAQISHTSAEVAAETPTDATPQDGPVAPGPTPPASGASTSLSVLAAAGLTPTGGTSTEPAAAVDPADASSAATSRSAAPPAPIAPGSTGTPTAAAENPLPSTQPVPGELGGVDPATQTGNADGTTGNAPAPLPEDQPQQGAGMNPKTDTAAPVPTTDSSPVSPAGRSEGSTLGGTDDQNAGPSPDSADLAESTETAEVADGIDQLETLDLREPVANGPVTRAATAQAPAPTSRPVIESATLQRVEAALEQLENAPPPRTLVLDVGDTGGLRIRLSSTADGVQVDVQSDRGQRDAAWEQDLRRSLAERGFDLDGRRDQGHTDPFLDTGDSTTAGNTIRTRPADTAVRL